MFAGPGKCFAQDRCPNCNGLLIDTPYGDPCPYCGKKLVDPMQERREQERRDKERREMEQREQERRDKERREQERREMEQGEQERREMEQREQERREMEQREQERRDKELEESKERARQEEAREKERAKKFAPKWAIDRIDVPPPEISVQKTVHVAPREWPGKIEGLVTASAKALKKVEGAV